MGVWGLWWSFRIVGPMGWRLLRQRRGSVRCGHANAQGNSRPLYGSDEALAIARSSAKNGHREKTSSTKNSSDIRSLIMNQIRSSLAPNRLVCSTRDWFYLASGCGLILSAVLGLVACVSVRVEPLTHESYPPRISGEPVQWLETEPGSSYIELARIIATSQSADEDRLRDKILARASMMGADAVVLGKSDVLESMGSGPAYESTLGPAEDSFSPYAGGWGGWPFYYDPWSFEQVAADQIGRTEYLSGTAIRYVSQKEAPHGY